MQVEPKEVRLLPGLTQKITLTLQPEAGFSGAVEFSVLAPDPGIGTQFTPLTLTLADGVAAKATLVLTATETTPPGAHKVAFQATAGGLARTAELPVEVPAASFFTVVTYIGPNPANFAYLAYQDGDGPWTSVPGKAGVYRLPVTHPGGKFGVLLGDVCRTGTAATWISNGFFTTLAETQMLQAMVFCNPQPGPPPETFDLTGALAGAGGASVLVSANTGVWTFPPGSTDYTLKTVKGTGDLIAGTYPSTQDYIPSRIIIDRGWPTQGSATHDFDFASQGSDPMPRLPIQAIGVEPGETFSGTVQYLTGQGQVAILGYGQDLAAYAPFPSPLAGDRYMYSFSASGPSHQRTLQSSGEQLPGPLSPRLPSNIPPFSVTSASPGTGRLALAWDAVTPRPAGHEVVIFQQLQQTQAYCYLFFASSWHAGAAKMTFTQPDFSELPGFNPSFLPQPGGSTEITIYQSGTQAGTALNLLPGLPGASLLPLAVLPGRDLPGSALGGLRGMRLTAGSEQPAAGFPGMRLRSTAPAAAAQPLPVAGWTEYWSVNRRQTLVP